MVIEYLLYVGHSAVCQGHRGEKTDVIPAPVEPRAGKQTQTTTLHYTVMWATVGKGRTTGRHGAGDLSLPRGQGRLP